MKENLRQRATVGKKTEGNTSVVNMGQGQARHKLDLGEGTEGQVLKNKSLAPTVQSEDHNSGHPGQKAFQ